MKNWLNAPVTRAEAIGWALTIPAVVSIWAYGYSTVRLLPDVGWLVSRHPDLTPGFLTLCISIGAGGLIAIFSSCGLLALGSQFSKQRPLVRVAAPVICYLLAQSVHSEFVASWRDLLKLIPTNENQATLNRLPR